jgi:hypothetical protein
VNWPQGDGSDSAPGVGVVVGDDVVVRVTQIDPRDQSWENDGPAYRVYFWTGESRCDEWELTEADVDEVLAWADAQAGGRTMSIWVVHRDDDGVGLIRLAGLDPTAAPRVWPSWAVPRRR